MIKPRGPRAPLLERTVPFVRLPVDLAAAAAAYIVLATAGALELVGGHLAVGAVLMVGATVVAVSAVLESMRRERRN